VARYLLVPEPQIVLEGEHGVDVSAEVGHGPVASLAVRQVVHELGQGQQRPPVPAAPMVLRDVSGRDEVLRLVQQAVRGVAEDVVHLERLGAGLFDAPIVAQREAGEEQERRDGEGDVDPDLVSSWLPAVLEDAIRSARRLVEQFIGVEADRLGRLRQMPLPEQESRPVPAAAVVQEVARELRVAADELQKVHPGQAEQLGVVLLDAGVREALQAEDARVVREPVQCDVARENAAHNVEGGC